MKNDQPNRKDEDTVARDKARDVAHDAVISVADEVHAMRKSIKKTADNLEKKWDETKPHREAVREDVTDAAHAIAATGEGIVDGIKDGLEHIRSTVDGGTDK